MSGHATALALDVCCGARMFWFDKTDARAVFVDRRRVTHTFAGNRRCVVNPDIEGCFTALPFRANRFAVVVFDPPHIVRAGPKSWMAAKYGKLEGNWKEQLRLGFASASPSVSGCSSGRAL